MCEIRNLINGLPYVCLLPFSDIRKFEILPRRVFFAKFIRNTEKSHIRHADTFPISNSNIGKRSRFTFLSNNLKKSRIRNPGEYFN